MGSTLSFGYSYFYGEQPPMPSVDTKTQMNYIICHWYRSSINKSFWRNDTSLEFPLDIIDVIINRFLYQLQFDYPESDNEYDYLFKLLVIGDGGVGKSSFVFRFADDIFEDLSITTIGIDFRIKNMKLHHKKIKIQMWDTFGQERFTRLAVSYYRGAHGIMIMYDISDRGSFENVVRHYKHVGREASDSTKKILVACKSDLRQGSWNYNTKLVTFEEGKELADKLNMKFIETSAKLGLNINESVQMIVSDIIDRYIDKEEKEFDLNIKPFYD